MSEDVRDFPAHGAGPDDDVHAQRLANEVADGVQLVGVEVDGHQQQHLAERSRQTGRLKRKKYIGCRLMGSHKILLLRG